MEMRQRYAGCFMAAVLLQYLTRGAHAANIGGDAECACIDPWAAGLTMNSAALDSTSSCPWTNNGTCFPVAYGAGQCVAHDANHNPICAVSNPPDYCAYTWCYVDPETCLRPNTASSFFGSVKMASGEDLSYSYATCGNLDYYNRGEDELRNLGRRIRVSWAPIDSSTGFTKLAIPEGDNAFEAVDSTGYRTGQTGAMVEYMSDLFDYYGIEWEFVPVSNDSMSYEDSKVTNCIHEVAINRTDMCWFDSWLLDSRLELSTMISIFTDTMFVMVRKEGDQTLTFASMMGVPFAPFTWGLWAVIVSQYFVSAIVIYVLEYNVNDEDFPAESVQGNIGESLFKGFQAAFGGGLLLAPKTGPGKIIMTGLTLSNMVFMSIYGAQVTTALVESRLTSPKGSMASFEEGLANNLPFCVYSFTADFIRARYPEMNVVEVGAGGNVHELFDALYEGKCDGSLIIENWWTAAKTGKYSSETSPLYESVYSKHAGGPERFHCDDKIFPLASTQTAWSIGNGIPIREELLRIFRFAIKKAQDDPARKYEVYAEKYKELYAKPVTGCNADAAVTSSGDDVAATLQDGVGATMVSIFFTAGGVIWYLVNRALPQNRAVEPAAEDADKLEEVALDGASKPSDTEQMINQRLAKMESVLLEAIERRNLAEKPVASASETPVLNQAWGSSE